MQSEMWRSSAGTNPEEEKDGISEMLLAWFQAGYSTARCIFSGSVLLIEHVVLVGLSVTVVLLQSQTHPNG